MVIKLSVEELGQGCNVVHLGFLDVLHTTKDILAGLLKFGLVHANFFFDAEIVTAGLLQLVGAGVVGETAVLKLFAGVLLLLAGISSRQLIDIPGTLASSPDSSRGCPAK